MKVAKVVREVENSSPDSFGLFLVLDDAARHVSLEKRI
jgi:hypothetical protein